MERRETRASADVSLLTECKHRRGRSDLETGENGRPLCVSGEKMARAPASGDPAG